MKEITFSAWCRYGKGDLGESEVEVELDEDEASRLISYGTKADVYYSGFSECKELEDIYKRIYSIAVDQMTDELREFGDLDAKYAGDPNWKVDDLYECGVEFPSEFEETLIEEE